MKLTIIDGMFDASVAALMNHSLSVKGVELIQFLPKLPHPNI